MAALDVDAVRLQIHRLRRWPWKSSNLLAKFFLNNSKLFQHHVWKILTLLTRIFPPFTHILSSRFNMIVIMKIVIGNNIGTRFCCNLSKCKASLSFLKVKETFWEIHFQSQKLNEPKVNFCLSDGVARSKLVKTNFSNELFFFLWKIQILLKICDSTYFPTWAVHI